MANANNERRKKLSKILVTIVVIVLAFVLETVVTNIEQPGQEIPETPGESTVG